MKFIKSLFLAIFIAFSSNVFSANSGVINVDPKICSFFERHLSLQEAASSQLPVALDQKPLEVDVPSED